MFGLNPFPQIPPSPAGFLIQAPACEAIADAIEADDGPTGADTAPQDAQRATGRPMGFDVDEINESCALAIWAVMPWSSTTARRTGQ